LAVAGQLRAGWARAAAFAALWLLFSGFSAGLASQDFPTVRADQENNPFGSDQFDPAEQQRRWLLYNRQRQKEIKEATARLLKLTTDLNEEIAKEKPAVLDPEQQRKLNEIEKLAHSIKEKMRLSMVTTPGFRSPQSGQSPDRSPFDVGPF